MYRIRYIRIFKHSWVVENFYCRAYVTCLRFLNSLSLLFQGFTFEKNCKICKDFVPYMSTVFSKDTKNPLGPDESSAMFSSQFFQMLKLIKPSWSQCAKSRFISFVFSTVFRMWISSFLLWLFLKLKWTNHSDIEWASMDRKKNCWTDKVD